MNDLTIQLSKFWTKLPTDLQSFIQRSSRYGLTLCFIGGITRDYLLSDKMGDDFDIEIRCDKESAFGVLENFLEENQYAFEVLKYRVYKVKLSTTMLEISFPRIESFGQQIHHSNFTASWVPDLKYEKAALRRDFTCNAIGFEYTKENFILRDPLNGLKDLKHGILEVCSYQDFAKDPVRLLRAVRMAVKYKLKYSQELKEMLGHNAFNHSNDYYFRSEMVKSTRPLSFLNECFYLNGLVSINEKLIGKNLSLDKSLLLAWYFLDSDTIKRREHMQKWFQLSQKKFKKEAPENQELYIKRLKQFGLNELLPTE